MFKRVNKFTYTAIAAALLALLLIISPICGGAPFARAATSSYSSALADLQKDSSFSVAAYPPNTNDYSLQVIQIAESTDGELLIYVYQPSGQTAKLFAQSIDIARQQDNDKQLEFKNYSLTLQNSTGVFFKYKVNNFALSSDDVRYYNISNILRPFDSNIDKPPADGYISEVPNRVAQLWTVRTTGDSVSYEMTTSEIITITQKVVGYCAYDDGYTLGWGTMDGMTKAYFVAFDTDRPIDKLISADLTFYATRAHCKICLNGAHSHDLFYDFHDPEYIDFGTGVYNDEPLTITDKQEFGNVGGGNVRPATKFLRKRIRKTADFIADENNKDYQITSAGADNLDGTQWVLNFYEAQDKYCADNVWLSFVPGVNLISGVADGDCELNNVFDVQILRLEFETDGKLYNLGVVDNKQTGNSNYNDYIGSGCNCLSVLPWWAWLLIVLFAPVAIVIVIKFLIWLVKLPFKALKKRKENNSNGTKKKKKPRKSKKA